MHPVKARLLRLRKKQAWLRRELAARGVSISKSHLSGILSGRPNTRPSWEVAKAIAAAVGKISASDVMDAPAVAPPAAKSA